MIFDPKTTKELEDAKIGATGDLQGLMQDRTGDPTLQNTLRDFRMCVHAWSDAVYNRPRSVLGMAPKHRAWHRATAWALGCVLAAGVAAGGIHELNHQQQLARATALREAENQRQLAEKHTREAEDLLAKVDSDISRQVPNAMEPLAQLMAEDESK